jgi:hypothetical protein
MTPQSENAVDSERRSTPSQLFTRTEPLRRVRLMAGVTARRAGGDRFAAPPSSANRSRRLTNPVARE